jgi:hypothetical protein
LLHKRSYLLKLQKDFIAEGLRSSNVNVDHAGAGGAGKRKGNGKAGKGRKPNVAEGQPARDPRHTQDVDSHADAKETGEASDGGASESEEEPPETETEDASTDGGVGGESVTSWQAVEALAVQAIAPTAAADNVAEQTAAADPAESPPTSEGTMCIQPYLFYRLLLVIGYDYKCHYHIVQCLNVPLRCYHM